MDLFTLKKLIGALLSPMTGGLFLFLGAFLLASASGPRRRRFGQVAGFLLLVVAWALGTSPVADALIRPFESRYEAVLNPSEHPDARQVQWVVVLGGGHVTHPGIPAPAQLRSESLYRLVEGLRLQRALPGTQLYLSGWGGNDPRSNAEAMADAAVALGADPLRIERAVTPRDTREEAEAFAVFLADLGEADRPFLLVSSAAHLPRAVRNFEAAGLRPIPAPAQAYAAVAAAAGAEARPPEGFRRFFPQARNYMKVERAVHEALGLVAQFVAPFVAPFVAKRGSSAQGSGPQ